MTPINPNILKSIINKKLNETMTSAGIAMIETLPTVTIKKTKKKKKKINKKMGL